MILGEADDGRIIGQECQYAAQCGHPGQIVKRFHQRTQRHLHKPHHTEFGQQRTQCPRQHSNCHDIEDGLHEQAV